MRKTFNVSWSTRFEYNEENVKGVVPIDKEGVYRLIFLKNQDYLVFYVGLGNLEDRLLSHLQASEPDECIKSHLENYKCYFRFAVIENEKDQMDVEWWIVKHYEPKCNDPEKAPHSGRYDEICVNPTNEEQPVCYKTGSEL